METESAASDARFACGFHSGHATALEDAAMTITQDGIPDAKPRLHVPTLTLVLVSLGLNVALLTAVLLFALQPDAREWMTAKLHLTTTEETESIAGASSGGLENLNYSLTDLASTADDIGSRLSEAETNLDETSQAVDDLTEFEHHVCRWGRDEATNWIGSDLYWTFAALRSPFSCPTF
jgi:hypothetical protein